MVAFTRGDGVKISYGGLATQSLRASLAAGDTLPGIVIEDVGGRNGPGVGTLTLVSSGGRPFMSWQAPGSGAAGSPQPVFYDGDYLLEDGSDPQKYIRLSVYPDYLPVTASLSVYLSDTFNALAPFDATQEGDISAANAAAGYTTLTFLLVTNVSPITVLDVRVWLDNTAPGFSYLSISSDGANYYTPTSETDPNVLVWASLLPGTAHSGLLFVKRITPPGLAMSAGILNVLQAGWTGL